MKKPDGFIKFLAIWTLLGGLINISEFFNFNLLTFSTNSVQAISDLGYFSQFQPLILGALGIIIGVGIFKLKKWALYGVIFLIGYGLVFAISNLLSNSYNATVIAVSVLSILFQIFIYSYLWQKRAMFK